MKVASKKEVTKVEENKAPAVYDYGDHAGAGFENTGREDYQVPMLYVTQALSPLVQEKKVEAGMLVNNVTGEVFDEIVLVPCLTQHVFVEWVPREKGGGFVGVHSIDSPEVAQAKASSKEFGDYWLPNGNQLVETFYVYCVTPAMEQVILPISSSKIKKYRGWMTRARSILVPLRDGRRINPPLYAHRYRLSITQEKGQQGIYYNIDVAFDGKDAADARLAPDSDLFVAASNFKRLASEGSVKVANPDKGADTDETAF